jgi:hypothetical protein
MLDILIPNLKIVSEANNSDHWTKKRSRRKYQQFWIRQYWNQFPRYITFPCHITLTRISPRTLDSDNLQHSLKGIRDEIADILIPGKKKGQADSDPRLTWTYKQEKQPKTYALRIQIL